MLITESKLVNTTREILRSTKEISIKELRRRLSYTFYPRDEEKRRLQDRNDTAFDQKVRNMISHRNSNGILEFADYTSNLLTSKLI